MLFSAFPIKIVPEIRIRLYFLTIDCQVLEINHPKRGTEHNNLRKKSGQCFYVSCPKCIQRPKIRNLIS